MAIGIRTFFRLAADQVFASATLANLTGFVIPVKIGQIVNVRARILATVGATGGLRAQFTSPGSSNYNADFLLLNTVAPAEVSAAILASAPFANALANAGTHVLYANCSIVFSTAGNFSLQMAQNTTDALTLNVEAGSFMEVITT